MTNTRITDPEVLELRYPVRLERYAIRRGSGGTGRWRGGDGAIRALHFLAPMNAAIVASRRDVAPFGMAGGGSGQAGRQTVRRADGRTEILPRCSNVDLAAGDTIIMETPGGGGFGVPNSARDRDVDHQLTELTQ